MRSIDAPGTLLGVFEDPDLTEVELRIGPGETALLYTDGITEARSSEGLYGTVRLTERLARSAGSSPDEIADDLMADALGFQGGRLRDDVEVLVVQVDRDQRFSSPRGRPPVRGRAGSRARASACSTSRTQHSAPFDGPAGAYWNEVDAAFNVGS